MQNAYVKINSLEDVYFIAGNDYTFIYDAYDDAGDPLDLSGSTILWKLCPYGRKDVLTASAAGTVSETESNKFIVELSGEDTADLESGVYIQQIEVTDSLNKKHIPGQGVVTIVSKIADS